MAYLTIARISGDPDSLLDGYRATSPLMDQVGHDHGLILHAGARTDDGILIVNLWPSRTAPSRPPRTRAASKRSDTSGSSPQQQRKEHHELDRYVLFG